MKTDTKITYEEYYKINDVKQYEVIEGELTVVPAPSFKHQNISGNIHIILSSFVKKNNLGVIVTAPIDVILDKTNIVQPDLVFVSKENISIINEDKGVMGTPDFVIEIISKGSKYTDTYRKKDLYEKFGIKEYWLIDPFSQSIEVFTLDENNKYDLYSEGFIEDSIKSFVFLELIVSVEEVFKKDW